MIDDPTDEARPGFADVRSALGSPVVRRWLLASSAAMAGLVAVQVHHVGAIEATACRSVWRRRWQASAACCRCRAALRRRPSPTGSASSTHSGPPTPPWRSEHSPLVAAGSIAWVWIFVVLTGIAFGSIAPMQGLYSAELYGQRRIGTLMGMQQLIVGSASAAGPAPARVHDRRHRRLRHAVGGGDRPTSDRVADVHQAQRALKSTTHVYSWSEHPGEGAERSGHRGELEAATRQRRQVDLLVRRPDPRQPGPETRRGSPACLRPPRGGVQPLKSSRAGSTP